MLVKHSTWSTSLLPLECAIIRSVPPALLATLLDRPAAH